MFTVRVKPEACIGRDELMEELYRDGIETRPVFYPMHLMPVYEERGPQLPGSRRYCPPRLQPPYTRLVD